MTFDRLLCSAGLAAPAFCRGLLEAVSSFWPYICSELLLCYYEIYSPLPASTLPFQLLLLISFQLFLICVLFDEELLAIFAFKGLLKVRSLLSLLQVGS